MESVATSPRLEHKSFFQPHPTKYARAEARTRKLIQAPYLTAVQPAARSRRNKLSGRVTRPLPTFPWQRSRRFGAKPVLPSAIAAVSNEDAALWFSRLPEKVKRAQFSVAERMLIASGEDATILDAAEERLLSLRERPTNQSLPALDESYSERTSFDSSSVHTVELVPAMPADSFLDDHLLCSFRWLEESEPDLSLDEYHVQATEVKKPKSKLGILEPSYRRIRSATNLSMSHDFNTKRPSSRKSTKSALGGVEHAWAISPTPAVPTVPSDLINTPKLGPASPEPLKGTGLRKSTDRQSMKSTHRKQQPLPGSEVSAEHYLNPEARLKLRLYLATPSKFDEALEFGFPSLQSPGYPRSSTSSRTHTMTANKPRGNAVNGTASLKAVHTQPDMKTFPRAPSYLSDNYSRPSSSCYSDSDGQPSTGLPETPSTSRFSEKGHMRRPSEAIDDDSGDSHLHGLPGREMTLRLTLTRSDLRAQEGSLRHDALPHGSLLRGNSVRQGSVGGKAKRMVDRGNVCIEDIKLDDGSTVAENTKGRGFRGLFTRKR